MSLRGIRVQTAGVPAANLRGIRVQTAGLVVGVSAVALAATGLIGGERMRWMPRRQLQEELAETAALLAAALDRRPPAEWAATLDAAAVQPPRWMARLDGSGRVVQGRGSALSACHGGDQLCAEASLGAHGVVVVGAPAPRPRPLDGRLVLLNLGLLAIAAAFAWVFASDLAHDLDAAARRLGEMAAGAEVDLRRSLPVSYPDEIAGLVAAVGRVHLRLTRELDGYRAALAGAEQAGRSRDAFLREVETAVRTPLADIRRQVTALLSTRLGPLTADQREDLQAIDAGARHLEELVRDIVELSRLESAPALELQTVDVAALVREVASIHEPLALKKGLSLGIDLPASLPAVRGEPRRLRQVLGNLLSNAVKFTERGEVVLAARAADGAVEITVRDSGIGIAESDLPYVFGEFSQSGERRQRGKGAGLGLAITRRLVELHGGRIDVQSAFGKGSTFRVRLPALGREQAKS